MSLCPPAASLVYTLIHAYISYHNGRATVSHGSGRPYLLSSLGACKTRTVIPRARPRQDSGRDLSVKLDAFLVAVFIGKHSHCKVSVTATL